MQNKTNKKNNNNWTIGWGFSSLCDLQCPFCYSSLARKSSKYPEVKLKQAESFLNNNKHLIKSINFGTGEFLLSQNFTKLLNLCEQYVPHSKIAITTNGKLSDLSLNELQIIKENVHECDISIDFATKEQHDKWRGKSGIYERAIEAIQVSKSLGLITSIVMIGTKQTLNRKNIEGLLNLADTYSIPLRINLYMPSYGDLSFIPSLESVFLFLDMLKKWSNKIQSSDPFIRTLVGENINQQIPEQSLSCRILPNGNGSPSTYLLNSPWIVPLKLENIKLDELMSTNPFSNYYNAPTPESCNECMHVIKCKGGSIERRWLWGNSLNKRDPLCAQPKKLVEKSENMSIDDNEFDWPGPNIHIDYLPTIIALPKSYVSSTIKKI